MRDIDKYTDDYVNIELKEFESYQVKYRRKMVLEQIKRYRPHKVLEIGCGMEPLFQWVKDVDFTIVEPSDGFCENAKKIAEMEKRNIQIIQGFFEETECNEKYDMIICSGLLGEVEAPERILKKITAICANKKGGVVHVNVPNAMSVHRLLAKESGLIQEVTDMSERNLMLQQHIVFTMESLTDLIEKTGFSILDKGSYFIKPFTHIQMEKLLEYRIIDEEILNGFYRLVKYMPDLGSEIFVNCKLG